MVGLVLVHGIGSQEPGATTKALIDALSGHDPSLELDPGTSTVRIDQTAIRVYEAWWADLLDGESVKGSFNWWAIQSVAWFPWLNLRAGMLDGRLRRLKAILWTVLAPPLTLLIQLGLRLAMFLPPARRALDERVSDVLNYVDSIVSTRADAPLTDVSAAIEKRVLDCVATAHRDGCEEIQIVGHSLGSVISYRVLCGASSCEIPPEQMALITRLYTIGSPIQKFALIWPWMLTLRSRPELKLRWHNFSDPLDAVSGRIGGSGLISPVENRSIFGRAGFLTAHGAYQRDPAFLEALLQGMDVTNFTVPTTFRSRLGRLAISILESLAGITAVLAVLLLGVAVTVAAAGVVTLVFLMVSLFGAMMDDYKTFKDSGVTFEGVARTGTPILLGLVVVVFPLTVGRLLARLSHYAYRYRVPLEFKAIWKEGPDPGAKRALGYVEKALIVLAGTIALYLAMDILSTELSHPWDTGLAALERIGLVIGWFVIASLLFIAMCPILVGIWKALELWLTWRAATSTPPDTR